MTDITALKTKIDGSGLKREFIAEKLGISRHALYQKANGITEFTTTEVQKLCGLLDITDLFEKERIFFASKVDE